MLYAKHTKLVTTQDPCGLVRLLCAQKTSPSAVTPSRPDVDPYLKHLILFTFAGNLGPNMLTSRTLLRSSLKAPCCIFEQHIAYLATNGHIPCVTSTFILPRSVYQLGINKNCIRAPLAKTLTLSANFAMSDHCPVK
jgi:hypothetical protein